MSSKALSKAASALRRKTSSKWLYSVFSVRKNLRRAGVLKNKSFTSTVVPRGRATGFNATSISRPEDIASQACEAMSVALLISRKRDTELMLANASPLKPSVATASRSSSSTILLVACESSANAISSLAMPLPLSRTSTRLVPPASISTSIFDALASRLFSINSLSTDAGRSTTSPAAI